MLSTSDSEQHVSPQPVTALQSVLSQQPVIPPQPITPQSVTSSHSVTSTTSNQLASLNNVSVPFETPYKLKASSSEAYLSGQLELARTAILIELGQSIPEVPVKYFVEHILPRNPDFEIAKIEEDLIVRNSLGDRWTAFPEHPGDSSLKEPGAFNPFKVVVDQIVTSSISCYPDLRRIVDFVNNPTSAPFSNRGSLTRPDGYFELASKKSVTTTESNEHAWDDIALSCEYENSSKNKEEIIDNTRKVLWSMHHIMREDPCRRFTFGITIEDTDARIWFCSRSDVIVSEKFNFMADHKTLIAIIASISFANDAQLGWDPTITRGIFEGKLCYYITVHDIWNDKEHISKKVYRTSEILSDAGALGFRGRGTRVFRARALNTTSNEAIGEDVAIKDVWVDATRLREGDIRKLIFDEAQGEDKELIIKHFLTVIAHGDVMIHGKPDHTQDLLMNGQVVPMENKFPIHHTVQPPSHNYLKSKEEPTSWDNTYHLRAPPLQNDRYPPKVHYRVVFLEVGIPVQKMESLAGVFHALADATIALRVVSKNLWIHRDVSPGNVLMCGDVGKLGDLEYMKKMTVGTNREVRTGTLDFMALEVEAQRYLFIPDRLESEVPGIILQALDNRGTDDQFPNPQFYHNTLHDLESVWWVAVWALFCRIIKSSTEHTTSSPTPSALQQLRASEIFPRTLGSAARERALITKGYFDSALGDLPTAVRSAGNCLEVVRQWLLKHYRKAESALHIDVNAFQIHDTVEDMLRKAEQRAAGILLSIPRISLKRPGESMEAPQPPKRKRDRSSGLDMLERI